MAKLKFIHLAIYLVVLSSLAASLEPSYPDEGTIQFTTIWEIAQMNAEPAHMKAKWKNIQPAKHYEVLKDTTAPLILRLIAACVPIADHAGEIIRQVLEGGKLNIVEKALNDFQTAADRMVQRFILTSLSSQFPDITIIGEEGPHIPSMDVESNFHRQDVSVLKNECPPELKNVDSSRITVWVDPLDGTSEYAKGKLDHVTVLIGIAVDSRAVAGIIHEPGYEEHGRTVWGLVGLGIFGLTPDKLPENELILATSRSQTDPLVQAAVKALNPTEVMYVGGGGHKVLLVLEHKAHVYLFASKGMKRWDTCASEALLNAAGGYFTDIRGHSYPYDKETSYEDEYGVFAVAIKSDHTELLKILPEDVKINFKTNIKINEE